MKYCKSCTFLNDDFDNYCLNCKSELNNSIHFEEDGHQLIYPKVLKLVSKLNVVFFILYFLIRLFFDLKDISTKRNGFDFEGFGYLFLVIIISNSILYIRARVKIGKKLQEKIIHPIKDMGYVQESSFSISESTECLRSKRSGTASITRSQSFKCFARFSLSDEITG